MIHRNRRTRRLLLPVALLALAGCSWLGSPNRRPAVVELGGYTTRSLFRDDVNTVAVPIFTTAKTLFRRDLEFQLTESVIKQVESRTQYKVVPKERADTVLEGEVLDLIQRVLIETPSSRPREVQVTIVVKVRWRDLRSGEVLREAERLTENATFVVDTGGTVARATDESFRRLSDRIVELMESDF